MSCGMCVQLVAALADPGKEEEARAHWQAYSSAVPGRAGAVGPEEHLQAVGVVKVKTLALLYSYLANIACLSWQDRPITGMTLAFWTIAVCLCQR